MFPNRSHSNAEQVVEASRRVPLRQRTDLQFGEGAVSKIVTTGRGHTSNSAKGHSMVVVVQESAPTNAPGTCLIDVHKLYVCLEKADRYSAHNARDSPYASSSLSYGMSRRTWTVPRVRESRMDYLAQQGAPDLILEVVPSLIDDGLD